MKSLFYKLTFCLCLISLVACSDDDNDYDGIDYSQKGYTVLDTLSVDLVKELYTTILTATNQQPGEITTLLSKIKYDVVLVKVEYKAVDPFGVEKTLSGLIAYPVLPTADKNKKLSLVSVQHGTLTYATQAPTKIDSRINQNSLVARDALGLVSAAHEKGYISVQADYFGYGSDEGNIHYYEHAKSLAQATRKLIEAAPYIIKSKNLNLDYDKLFLFGYSEGGYTTIATLKSFSENSSTFKDFVTVAGAGAYDKTTSLTFIVQQTSGESSKFSASYAWVFLNYNRVYKLNRSLSEMFSQEVIETISKYTDNNNIMTDTSLPSSPIEAFNSDFVTNMANRTDKGFMDACKDNDVVDFAAKGKVTIVWGNNDTWVPTFNSETLASSLEKRNVDVTKIILEGGTHATTYVVFANEAANKLFE